jgi:photosynthetic reaction center cytochrome c subunit
MNRTSPFRVSLVVAAACCLTLTVVRAQNGPPRGGQQAPEAPQGPLAPEKYKNIQVLKDVPADQLLLAMRYITAATGLQCSTCHVRDEATGQWQYDKDDKRSKQTARNMMRMVYAINANARDYGLNSVSCGTCHAGHNQPPGLQMAGMATPDEIAQAAAFAARQAAAAAARGEGGRGGAQGRGGFQGRGRGQQPPAPPVDDILNKYLDAVGGQAALTRLQSLVLSGNMTNRLSQTVPFTIEEKAPGRYRATLQTQPAAMTTGFDGTTGWTKRGDQVNELSGFDLDQALRMSDFALALHIKDKYATLQASGRPARIEDKTATLVQGRAGIVTEQFFFDSDTGLLLRRRIITRTPLGPLSEQIDYADYKDVAGVKIPFQTTYTDWNTLDTFKVVDVKPNAQIADAQFTRPGGGQ